MIRQTSHTLSFKRLPKPKLLTALVLVPALLLLALPMTRQASASEAWEFTVVPYLLAPSIKGEAGLGRFLNGVSVDVDSQTIFENLDLGGMIHGEAWYESRVGILADLSFMDLSSKSPGPLIPGATIKGEVFQSVAELYGAYRFELFRDKIDLYGGARWWHMDVKLTSQNSQGPSSFIDNSEDWVDPVAGARWIAQLGPDWRSSLAADVGGFGVGSDFSLSLQALAIYDMSASTSLAFGYRILSVDYDNGDAGSPNYFAYDTVTHGPMVGVAFRF